MDDLITKLRKNRPLIHCIVGPVASNFCANGALAIGARPIMAEHPLEVNEITASAQGLLLNLSGISDVKMESMKKAAVAAGENGIPTVIDAVGVSCSSLRRRFVLELLNIATPSVIKGNYSEIYALHNEKYHSSGVDSEQGVADDDILSAAINLAKNFNCVVLVSGETDIITDGTRVAKVKNGVAQLGNITATGCLLGTICACFASHTDPFSAAVSACAVLGICGERAEAECKNGSFMYGLLDELSSIDHKKINEMIKIEEQYYEKA